MPRASKICAKPGCPRPTTASLCPPHARAADKARGTSTQRGYGADHQRTRQALAPHVATGTVNCARCGQPIQPGQDWHLDHDDHDRTKYIGPSHAHCNDSAAGTKSHQQDTPRDLGGGPKGSKNRRPPVRSLNGAPTAQPQSVTERRP